MGRVVSMDERAARHAGVTKYPFSKMLKLALNAITGFSYFPLQLATYFGFGSAGLAILAIPVVIILRLAGPLKSRNVVWHDAEKGTDLAGTGVPLQGWEVRLLEATQGNSRAK